MWTKYPLTLLLMEVSELMRKKAAKFILRWVARGDNQEADDLTNADFGKFSQELRLFPPESGFKWEVLDGVIEQSKKLYDEIQDFKEHLKRNRQVGRVSLGKAKRKFFDRWTPWLIQGRKTALVAPVWPAAGGPSNQLRVKREERVSALPGAPCSAAMQQKRTGCPPGRKTTLVAPEVCLDCPAEAVDVLNASAVLRCFGCAGAGHPASLSATVAIGDHEHVPRDYDWQMIEQVAVFLSSSARVWSVMCLSILSPPLFGSSRGILLVTFKFDFLAV
eukprot:Skav210005  [mRNA]  locus=scaffold1212:11386:12817:- [translate_table: standard]